MFISISGEAGAGKDTLAVILEDYYKAKGVSFAPFSFAGPLKDACVLFFNWDRHRLDHDFDYKEGGLGNTDPTDVDPYCVALGLTRRQFFQKFGTEAMRYNVHPDFWVILMREWIKEGRITTADVNLIRDARFLNELNFVKDMGGICIRVRRLEVGAGQTEAQAISETMRLVAGNLTSGTLTKNTDHASEQEWRKWTQWDYQVFNPVFADKDEDFGKQRFRSQVSRLLREMDKKKDAA